MSIDLSDPLEWNLVYRQALTAAPSGTITPIVFVTTHHQIVVGVKVADEPTWKWGGYLTEQIEAKVSSTANLFNDLIRVGKYRLTCEQYQAIDLNPAIPLPFICTIEFPKWFRECQVEVYARNDI
jgi:hypothetical protein